MVVRFLNAVTAESEKLVAFINNIAVLNTAAGILVAAPDIVDTWDPLAIEDELEANWREVKATINPFKEWMTILSCIDVGDRCLRQEFWWPYVTRLDVTGSDKNFHSKKSLINQQLTLYQTCSAAKNKRIFG